MLLKPILKRKLVNEMTRFLQHISLFALVAMLQPIAQAQTTYTSVAAGNWSNTATWSPAGIPGATDNVTIAAGHSVTLTAAVDLTTGNLTVTGTLALAGFNLTAGSLAGAGNIGSASGTPLLTVGSNNSNTEYSGSFSGTGARLTKAGTGTFTLSGANTYTGAATINAGTLQIGAGGTTGSINISSSFSVSSGATLAFNRSDVIYQNVAVPPISGAGTVVQRGSGTLGLRSASNAMTGNLRIERGTLNFGNSQTNIGTGTITLGVTGGTDPVTLQVSDNNNVNFSNAIVLASGHTGSITFEMVEDDLSVSHFKTFTGGVTGTNNLTIRNNGGTGAAADNLNFTTNPINIAGTLTHVGTGTGVTTINGVIGSNVASLAQGGTAMLVLAGANTYTGATTVSAGTLVANNTSALGATSSLSLSGTGSVRTNVSLSLPNTALAITTTTAKFNCNGLNSAFGQLSLGGVFQPTGTYGSTASSATTKTDLYFTSTSTGFISTADWSLFRGGSGRGDVVAIKDFIISAPVIGTIMQPTCATATGSVALSGLPSGSWTLTATPSGSWSGSGSTYTVTGLTANTTYTFSIFDGVNGSPESSPAVINAQPAAAQAGAASGTPTLCVNTVLTNITHTTTGATGIGTATGLPAGVTASWSGNTITISGTPTQAGTFNYAIPLAGGCVASDPPVATGGTVVDYTLNGVNYRAHVFTSNGTLNVTAGVYVEYLIIGGGGGGARGVGTSGGGGGAGGYRSSVEGEFSGGGTSAESSIRLTPQAYPVIVGAGGGGGGGSAQPFGGFAGSPGGNSSFAGIVSLGGGPGHTYSNAANGFGSGGGTSFLVSGGGTGTAGQGYNGGGDASGDWAGGGGGGAGGNGANTSGSGPSASGGAGGAGLTSAITGTATARAGGGGGSDWDLPGSAGTATAGGGAGGQGTNAASSANANTGGGGGGSAQGGNPGNGGSGIVIVRYALASATGTITVNQNTTTAASSTPTRCINTALPSITHTTSGATGISNAGVSGANGLPAGVSASWASNTITISGTPTASGTFNYSIPLTGGCGGINATGTITVTPANTAGAASSNPTVAINTAITPITHTTTGATGIGTATNLPTGVTAGWASNTITISGTPTESGTFNYSISLTGGCGSVNATGSITVDTPLPITLRWFTSECEASKITLKWATASETNNDYFTVERTVDGLKFDMIGTVPGAGNSSQPRYYSFTDTERFSSRVYYRLKQTDFDGQFEYTNVISVTCIENRTEEFRVYPNPIANQLTIEPTNHVEVVNFEIINSWGVVVHQGRFVQKTTIDTFSLVPGLYIIKVQSGDNLEFKKVIKQ